MPQPFCTPGGGHGAPIPHRQRRADFLCSFHGSRSHCLLEPPVCLELYKFYPSPQPLCKGVVSPHFATKEAVAQRGEASYPGRVTQQASAEPGISSQALFGSKADPLPTQPCRCEGPALS